MIPVYIPPEFITQATAKARRIGALRNSIYARDDHGRIAGFIGELLIQKMYGGRFDDAYGHDLVIDGRTAEVKTQCCNAPPSGSWHCTVAAASAAHQRPDDYYFVQLRHDFSKGWIIGYISREQFFAHAVLRRKGEGDPPRRDFVFRADCYNLSIRDVQRLGGQLPKVKTT